MFATILTEKIFDPRKAKEQYQSLIRKKNTKSVKQSKILTQQPKTFENPNIVNIKSVTEHPKTSQNSFKAEQVSSSSLYSNTKIVKHFWTEKM